MQLLPLMLVPESIWTKFYATKKDFSSKDYNLKKENKARESPIIDPRPNLPSKKPKFLFLRDHMESFLKMRFRRILTRLANSSYRSSFHGKCTITTMNCISRVQTLISRTQQLRSSLSKGSSFALVNTKIDSKVTVNQEVSRTYNE